MKFRLILFLIIAGIMTSCNDNISDKEYTKVTEENYALAETQVIFTDYKNRIAAATGSKGTGDFLHVRTASDPKDTTVVRINFDTRYSMCLLDLTCDAVLTMPETGGRYQSAWFVTEEHYNPMAITKPGTYTITQKDMGSRYVLIIIRTQVNMQDEKDMAAVSELQDKIKIEQKDKGSYEVTNKWDMEEIMAMRYKYIDLANEKNLSPNDMFGKKGKLSQENHNCGVAYGWGGFTSDQAVYINYISAKDSPATLTLKDVPIADNAFWSVTVYDKGGYVQEAPYNINSAFATYNEDGSATIHFGGENTSAPNYLAIFPGWTCILRIYLPQEEYFSKKWVEPVLEYKD